MTEKDDCIRHIASSHIASSHAPNSGIFILACRSLYVSCVLLGVTFSCGQVQHKSVWCVLFDIPQPRCSIERMSQLWPTRAF